MKLKDIDILNNIFYESWNILNWIEKHPNMTELDKEALSQTILHALVFYKIIDPQKQSLDFNTLTILNNLNGIKYNPKPNIIGYPEDLKQKLRMKKTNLSGGAPASIFLSKPQSKISRFCVYDPNTVMSSFFEKFIFIEASYNSPTREGVRVKQRPFVIVPIFNDWYIVDILTKRLFNYEYFKKNYNLEILDKVNSKELDKEKQKMYHEQTDSIDSNYNFTTFLSLAVPLMDFLDNPEMAEYKYEIEQSKKYHKEAWLDKDKLDEEMSDFLKRGKK